MPLKVADSFSTLAHAYADTLMTCTMYQLIITTHAINDNTYAAQITFQCKLTISTDHITRMAAYSDEKEPKMRERESKKERTEAEKRERKRQQQQQQL